MSPFNIKTVLIVLSIVNKIDFDEINCMKFFLSDIREKGIKSLIVLTHIDKLKGIKENDKLMLIEERIQTLKKELDIKDRDDFICIENYKDFPTNSTGQKDYHLTNKRTSFPNSQNMSQNLYRYPPK